MAALRRLIPLLTNSSTARRFVACGSCVTAAAGAGYYYYYYYYYYRGSLAGRRCGLKSNVEARLFHLALPAVSATEKVQWGILLYCREKGHFVKKKRPYPRKERGICIYNCPSHIAHVTDTLTLMRRQHEELSWPSVLKWQKTVRGECQTTWPNSCHKTGSCLWIHVAWFVLKQSRHVWYYNSLYIILYLH